MESVYTDLALCGSKNECARTDTVFSPISQVCTRGLTLNRPGVAGAVLQTALLIRETVLSLTSDMGKKTVSVLAHSFLLPQRANLGYILSISPLRYSRS